MDLPRYDEKAVADTYTMVTRPMNDTLAESVGGAG